jgi:LacI family transcriptional regulator
MSQISAQRRRDSFVDTMLDAGITVPTEYIIETGYEAERASEDAHQLLTLPDPPTAIFAANDFIASRVIRAAEQLGHSVPQTLSVVGYDNNPISDIVHRLLTTIHQPTVEIGRRATELLIRQIDGEIVEVRTELLAPELIVRDTTAPPRP